MRISTRHRKNVFLSLAAMLLALDLPRHVQAQEEAQGHFKYVWLLAKQGTEFEKVARDLFALEASIRVAILPQNMTFAEVAPSAASVVARSDEREIGFVLLANVQGSQGFPRVMSAQSVLNLTRPVRTAADPEYLEYLRRVLALFKQHILPLEEAIRLGFAEAKLPRLPGEEQRRLESLEVTPPRIALDPIAPAPLPVPAPPPVARPKSSCSAEGSNFYIDGELIFSDILNERSSAVAQRALWMFVALGVCETPRLSGLTSDAAFVGPYPCTSESHWLKVGNAPLFGFSRTDRSPGFLAHAQLHRMGICANPQRRN